MSPAAPAATALSPDHPLHVLHVVDARDGVEPILAARAAMDVPARHDVILIGNTRDERNAALLGLVTTDRVGWHGSPSRDGIAAMATAAFFLRLRRLARDRLAARAGRTPILLAHGPHAAVAARSAVPRRVPMLATLPRSPLHKTPDQRLALALEDDVAVTFDLDIAAAWRDSDVHDVRVLPIPRPEIPASTRAELRERLNLDPETLVLATLADPPAVGDGRRLASFTGWLYTMDRRALALAPRDRRTNELVRRGVRFTRLHGRRWGMLELDLPLPLLFPCCDLAIMDSAAPDLAGPIIVRAAQAAGVATVVPRAAWLRRLHPDPEARATLFAPNATALTMIHRVGHVSETPDALAAAKAAALRCAGGRRGDDPAAFPRELHRLIAERLNLPVAPGEPRFVPAALAAGAR